MKLTDADKSSLLWITLRDHLKARLDEHRTKNDSNTLDETSTAHLRGRIAELKELLRLEEIPPETF